MATVFHTQDPAAVAAVHDYLALARKRFTQAQIAEYLKVDPRTVQRWNARQSEPPVYLAAALRQMLFPMAPDTRDADFTFIDLFAGIGGIRLGFEASGGKCVFTSEWDANAQKTYAANFPDGHAIYGDITQIDAHGVPDHDVLLAGFPCQPFSIAGVSKKNSLGLDHGFADLTQGTLFFDVARIIEAKRPKAFLLENVKNLQSHDKGRTFEIMKHTLTEDLGYHINIRVIDGQHFVPQHRERILIAGFREPNGFDWNALQLQPKGIKRLRDILHPENGTEEPEAHYTEGLKAKVSSKYVLSDHLWAYLQAYAEKHRLAGNGFGFGLVGKDDVTRTLSARYHKDGSEILINRGKNKNPRRLTPRECARLMGFPDSYKLVVSDTQAYQLLSQAAVVPMIREAATLMLPYIKDKGAGKTAPEVTVIPGGIMTSGRWTKDQLKVAFNLYCQLPFGKLHQRNKEIIALAKLIGRTPSAVAMKLVNFASLDPAITGSGRSGLGNASNADREVWDEFHADWQRLAYESQQIVLALRGKLGADEDDDQIEEADADYTGETKRQIVETRIKQSFFRKAVLSSYQGKCCMTGLADARLLLASHIVPWSKDKPNRLNPRNGLCLSALHDKAFDRGLITVLPNLKIEVSKTMRSSKDSFFTNSIGKLHGSAIQSPEKFAPDKTFLDWHNKNIFLGR